MKNKELLITFLTKKNNGTNKLTFNEISVLTGYHPKSLIRLNKVLQEKGSTAVKVHGNIGKKHNSSLNDTEFIIEQKRNCLEMSFLKFYEYYNGLVLNLNNDFKPRSYSYIYNVLTKNGITPVFGHGTKGCLPSKIEEIKSLLIFKDIEIKLKDLGYITLFLTLDAVSNRIIYMHVSKKANKTNYYIMLRNIIKSNGIPENIYAYGQTVFRAPKNNITQFHRICNELDINVILYYDSKLQKIINTLEKDILKDLPNLLNVKIFESIKEMNYFVKNEYVLDVNQARTQSGEKSIFKQFHNDIFNNTLCEKYKRKIVYQGSQNNVQFRNMLYHIEGLETILKRGTEVSVYLYQNGDIKVWYDGNLYMTRIVKKLSSVKGRVRK